MYERRTVTFLLPRSTIYWSKLNKPGLSAKTPPGSRKATQLRDRHGLKAKTQSKRNWGKKSMSRSRAKQLTKSNLCRETPAYAQRAVSGRGEGALVTPFFPEKHPPWVYKMHPTSKSRLAIGSNECEQKQSVAARSNNANLYDGFDIRQTN